MNIKIYSMSIEEVVAILRLADQESFIETGSHDDSGCVVFINGIKRVSRRYKFTWTSVQESTLREETRDPGEMPVAVLTAAVLETSSHYGSSQRPRSLLRLFLRRNGYQQNFLVLDIGQVGTIFKSPNLIHVLAQAKNLRVQIEGDLKDSLCPVSWSKFYSEDMREKVGSAYLSSEVAEKWFEIMLGQAKKTLEAYHTLCVQQIGERDTNYDNWWVKTASPLFGKTLLGRWLYDYLDFGEFNKVS